MQESAEKAPQERRDHGNLGLVSPFSFFFFFFFGMWEGRKQENWRGRRLTYPEIIITGRPHLGAVSNHVRYQSRSKVPGEVDGISGLPAKSRANAKNQEEEAERHEFAGAGIEEGVDAEHQDGTADELVPEH